MLELITDLFNSYLAGVLFIYLFIFVAIHLFA